MVNTVPCPNNGACGSKRHFANSAAYQNCLILFNAGIDRPQNASKQIPSISPKPRDKDSITLSKEELEKRLKKFNNEYDFIYDSESRGRYVAGYDEALEHGDDLLKNAKGLVLPLAQLRDDMFTSDREIAALGFTFEDAYITDDGVVIDQDETYDVTKSLASEFDAMNEDMYVFPVRGRYMGYEYIHGMGVQIFPTQKLAKELEDLGEITSLDESQSKIIAKAYAEAITNNITEVINDEIASQYQDVEQSQIPRVVRVDIDESSGGSIMPPFSKITVNFGVEISPKIDSYERLSALNTKAFGDDFSGKCKEAISRGVDTFQLAKKFSDSNKLDYTKKSKSRAWEPISLTRLP